MSVMWVADSILAATVLLHRLPLVTRNEALALENINPFTLQRNV